MNERPSETDYAPYYQRYVSLVPETDVMAGHVRHHLGIVRSRYGIDA